MPSNPLEKNCKKGKEIDEGTDHTTASEEDDFVTDNCSSGNSGEKIPSPLELDEEEQQEFPRLSLTAEGSCHSLALLSPRNGYDEEGLKVESELNNSAGTSSKGKSLLVGSRKNKSDETEYTEISAGQNTYQLINSLDKNRHRGWASRLKKFGVIIPQSNDTPFNFGEGFTSTVRIGKEKGTNTFCAVKKMRGCSEEDKVAETIARMKAGQKEAKLVQALVQEKQVTGILPVKDYMTVNNAKGVLTTYQILPIANIGALDEVLIYHFPKLTPEEQQAFIHHLGYFLITVVTQLTELNIFHRDIKLSNCLLDSSKGPHLCDFGAAVKISRGVVDKRSPAGSYDSSYTAPEFVAYENKAYLSQMVQSLPTIREFHLYNQNWQLGLLLLYLNNLNCGALIAQSFKALKEEPIGEEKVYPTNTPSGKIYLQIDNILEKLSKNGHKQRVVEEMREQLKTLAEVYSTNTPLRKIYLQIDNILEKLKQNGHKPSLVKEVREQLKILLREQLKILSLEVVYPTNTPLGKIYLQIDKALEKLTQNAHEQYLVEEMREKLKILYCKIQIARIKGQYDYLIKFDIANDLHELTAFLLKANRLFDKETNEEMNHFILGLLHQDFEKRDSTVLFSKESPCPWRFIPEEEMEPIYTKLYVMAMDKRIALLQKPAEIQEKKEKKPTTKNKKNRNSLPVELAPLDAKEKTPEAPKKKGRKKSKKKTKRPRSKSSSVIQRKLSFTTKPKPSSARTSPRQPDVSSSEHEAISSCDEKEKRHPIIVAVGKQLVRQPGHRRLFFNDRKNEHSNPKSSGKQDNVSASSKHKLERKKSDAELKKSIEIPRKAGSAVEMSTSTPTSSSPTKSTSFIMKLLVRGNSREHLPVKSINNSGEKAALSSSDKSTSSSTESSQASSSGSTPSHSPRSISPRNVISSFRKKRLSTMLTSSSGSWRSGSDESGSSSPVLKEESVGGSPAISPGSSPRPIPGAKPT